MLTVQKIVLDMEPAQAVNASVMLLTEVATVHNAYAQSRDLTIARGMGGAQLCPGQIRLCAFARASTMVSFAQSSIALLEIVMAMVNATLNWANATVLLAMVAPGVKRCTSAQRIARATVHAS